VGEIGVESGSELAGAPDGMGRLWSPHRLAYINGQDKPSDTSVEKCPFCRVPGLSDDEGLIVHRGELAYVVMNLYPYAAGHILVCPYRHEPAYADATADEVLEIAELTQKAIRVLGQVSHPAGFNIGINQGSIGGAGIAGHLHQHVVPRWSGDANFMPIIARTHAVPQLLGDTRQLLAEAWPR
jgi:ATP adenylyltransferase